MKKGIFYGIGIGPGDPDLITAKGVAILGVCPHVFAPKAREKAESLALAIARKHIGPGSQVHEIVFPMTSDKTELDNKWEAAASAVAEVLETGEDACFLTLGDTFLYSTYIYLLRALRNRIPDLNVVTVPGITSFSAAAAIAEFPIGEAKKPVTIVPTADDLDAVREAVSSNGSVILMKIGKRLGRILEVLEELDALDRSVFLSHVCMENQRVETDLSTLKDASAEAGYLSIILVRGKAEEGR